MVTYADMPWWIGMMILFGFVGPLMRMSMRGGPWGRHGGSKALRDQEVQRLDAALGERDQVIEDLQRRLGELEERLDFTERLIASRSTEAVSRQ
jgi:hypothetical protein